eukprot:CAMPEP_0114310626 /NCGR_PEP_ID=MMETSP0059-20121206/19356_1 /TAXON_ID=36894 /ORGANISM="Pyramimonas parkeae, Strain CCMP726" /LENGTH=143 /DNA_ID=CAMNT_0001434675 /DNA_START=46 /DNA_END=477 /DNA_ORIENTATION=+
MTDACFDMFDTDRSGFMDTDELHKALNALYDKVNSTLNCNMKHPTVEEVHAMLAESEVGQDRPTISKQGFRDMVTGNFSSRKFTDTIAFKLIRNILMQVVVWPLLTTVSTKALKGRGFKIPIPEAFVIPTTKMLSNIARAVVP